MFFGPELTMSIILFIIRKRRRGNTWFPNTTFFVFFSPRVAAYFCPTGTVLYEVGRSELGQAGGNNRLEWGAGFFFGGGGRGGGRYNVCKVIAPPSQQSSLQGSRAEVRVSCEKFTALRRQRKCNMRAAVI